jgi:MOSC domain-containing protein YiiM
MADGTLAAIWIKRAHGGVMDGRRTAFLDERGLVDNANRGGKRQITLISEERWNELMAEVGAHLPASARRANLVVRGIDLEGSRGRTLSIGRCALRINGETRPCELMEEAAAGLQSAMRARWGGGAFGEVVEGGAIEVGDPVAFIDT